MACRIHRKPRKMSVGGVSQPQGQLGSVLGSAGSGAQLGAKVGGPIGGIIGAAAGIAVGGMKVKKQIQAYNDDLREQEALQRQARTANIQQTPGYQNIPLLPE